jgi:zinc-binding alcohol dehydrogenase/oxidoreductase
VILPALAWGEGEDAPSGNFRILGGPDDGTYAELVKVPEANVYPKPNGFSWGAAALPLAGLTAYRALFSVGRLQARAHSYLGWRRRLYPSPTSTPALPEKAASRFHIAVHLAARILDAEATSPGGGDHSESIVGQVLVK